MRKVRGVHEKKQIKISVICVEKETCGENSLEEYEKRILYHFQENNLENDTKLFKKSLKSKKMYQEK